MASSAMASEPASWNRYSYAGGDPVNRSDPHGLCVTDDQGNFWDNAEDVLYDWGVGDCEDNPEWVSWVATLAPGSFMLNGGPYYPGGDDGQTSSTQPTQSQPSTQPTCEIGLFYRKAFNKRLPWNHAYLDATCTYADGETLSETIQADPGPKPVVGTGPTAPGGYLGPPYLVGVVTSPYAGPGGSGPGPNNFQVGSWDPISYLTLLNIQAAVLNYDYNFVQPYTLFPYSKTTYNSNSFVNTLNVNFGLGFGQPPGSSPGWNNLIPGLGP